MAGPRLSGRRIVITGGASGMGRAIAELFQAEGARVALLDVNVPNLEATAGALKAAAVPCDVASQESVRKAVVTAAQALGGIDGLVNAAGILRAGPFDEFGTEEWMKIQSVNALGPYLVSKAALSELGRAQGASIVNIASIAALRPFTGRAAYCVSKASVLMLTKCMALEFAPKIRVNAICPGLIKTPMTEYAWQNPAEVERLTSGIAMKRIGLPQEVAQAALYLTSAESSFVTGTEMVVDGGSAYH